MDTTRDNNIGNDRKFQKQEQERDNSTGQWHTMDLLLDNNTGRERTFQTQEQDRNDSTGV